MITLTSKTLVNESECVNTWINKLNQNKVFSDRVACNILEREFLWNLYFTYLAIDFRQEWRNIKYLGFDYFSLSLPIIADVQYCIINDTPACWVFARFTKENSLDFKISWECFLIAIKISRSLRKRTLII